MHELRLAPNQALHVTSLTLCFTANNIAIASAKVRPTDVETSTLVGASLSEPHTCRKASAVTVYMYIYW